MEIVQLYVKDVIRKDKRVLLQYELKHVILKFSDIFHAKLVSMQMRLRCPHLLAVPGIKCQPKTKNLRSGTR